jgi:hypothetical protein
MFADLIEHLEPDPYSFGGHYWTELQPGDRERLEFKCEFTNDTQAVLATWDHAAFELRVLFAGGATDRARAELFIRGFGRVNGDVVFADGNILFTGRSDLATVFASVWFGEGNRISLTGTFEANGERRVYSLVGGIDEGPASIANVKSIAKRA